MAEMTVYDELVARGLIAQVTDEELIKNLINNGRLHSILVLIQQQTVFMQDILWHSAL